MYYEENHGKKSTSKIRLLEMQVSILVRTRGTLKKQKRV